MSGRVENLRLKYGINATSMTTIKEADPTSNLKYLPWLLSVRYTKRPSDGKYVVNKEFPVSKIELVKNLLTWFDYNLNGNKIPVEYRNIHTFKSVNKFIEVITEIKKPSISDIKKQIRVVLDDDDFKILVPLTIESSRLYGSNTMWCTTQESHFRNYTSNGFLYYIIDKRTGRKFGCSIKLDCFRPSTFYNNEDDNISKSQIEKVYGKDFFAKVIDAMKVDYDMELIKIKKKKALDSAIKRLSTTKKEFESVGMELEGLDVLLEKLESNSF